MSDHIQLAQSIVAHELYRDIVDITLRVLIGRLSVCEYTRDSELTIPDARPIHIDARGRADQNNAAAFTRERDCVGDRASRADRVVNQ